MAIVPFEGITRRKNAYGLYRLRKLYCALSTGIGYSSLYERNGKSTEIAKSPGELPYLFSLNVACLFPSMVVSHTTKGMMRKRIMPFL